MPRLRTTARALLLFALFGLLAGTAAARTPDPSRWRPATVAAPKTPGKQIVFPVIGAARLTSSFGDPRGQGAHQGEDIMSVRRALAVAAEAGRVRFHTGSGRAGCTLYLYANSGWKYLYVHLNNDLTARNDNRGGCVNGVAFPKGLKDGQRVSAGQPVGFVGDSGDANGIEPHLHFEMHPQGLGAVDPLPYLKTARRLLFHAPPGAFFTLAITGKVVAVGADALRVRIGTLRASTMSQTLRKVGRSLMVTVPVGALVERAASGAQPIPAKLANAKPGETVSVWTELAQATAGAQLGKDGALAAERVLLPPAA
ncbi:MAG: M23 family metallopeptidase [Gaiellaceae bacterium]